MNKFTYEEITIGQVVSFNRQVTNDMLDKFRYVSGDTNPLHNNDVYAMAKGYPSKVVFGMLTASLYSTLAGVYIPGENCILHSVNADFLYPVFPDDVLTVTGQVIAKHDSVRQIVLKATIRNQNNKKVSKAIIEAGVI